LTPINNPQVFHHNLIIFGKASRETPKQIWKEGIKKGIYPNFFW